MRALESTHRRSALTAVAPVARHFSCAAVLTAGALLLAGCSAADLPETRVQAFNATPSPAQALPGAPMAVSCEANQRAVVHPVMMNGVAVSQVDCVSSAVAPVAAPGFQPGVASPMPVNYGYQYPVDAPRVVPATYSAPRVTETRTVPTRSARVEPQGRGWKKSALIIGSSAGVGAGVGGAVGGKKGALIGAAIGGGGATIWDQMTRKD
jgi:hypothetical protein